MIPSAMEFVILALAAYRLTRLAGWDDFPLAVKIRAWAIGQRWIPTIPESGASSGQDDELGRFFDSEERVEFVPSLPGKQPPSEVEGVRPAYDRPTLAHLVHCPFCIGFYLSVGTYTLWVWQPHWSMFVLTPFALSGAVGLIAKNLDA